MPFKQEVLNYVDEIDEETKRIGATNTILNKNGKLTAYNTDAFSSYCYLSRLIYYKNFDTIFILGDGGYSKAVQFSAKKLFRHVRIITRKDWLFLLGIENSLIFNCTPVEVKVDVSNIKIDSNVNTKTGKELALLQASKQFEIYTGEKFPMEYIKSIYEK